VTRPLTETINNEKAELTWAPLNLTLNSFKRGSALVYSEILMKMDLTFLMRTIPSDCEAYNLKIPQLLWLFSMIPMVFKQMIKALLGFKGKIRNNY
jgi:hypothetical protein